MKLSAAKEGMFSMRIDIGHFFGEEDPSSVTVTLREMTVSEGRVMSKMKESQYPDYIIKMLPALIIDHDFNNEDDTKSTAQEVGALIQSRVSLNGYVLDEFTKRNPFLTGTAAIADKSPSTISTADGVSPA